MAAPARTKPRIILGITGSVAAVKAGELIQALRPWAVVKVVYTAHALKFTAAAQAYNPEVAASWQSIGAAQAATDGMASASPALTCDDAEEVQTFIDAHEWDSYMRVGEPVLHIELRKWADCLLIAPTSANTLAKLAHGMADNLLTCVARAWDWEKPMCIAPAMNTAMWTHPATRTQLDTLSSWGVHVVAPTSKKLACGDVGVGAMASVEDVMQVCQGVLHVPGVEAVEA